MNSESLDHNNQILKRFTIIFVVIFLILSVFLGTFGPQLMIDGKCYPFLGCNSGFFGYDALVHFISGIMDAALIIFLFKKFSSTNLFNGNFHKNLIIIVSIVISISFLWEVIEFSHDQLRMKVLNIDLVSLNKLDQPSNEDTMGDITFSIIGATITAFVFRPLIKKKV